MFSELPRELFFYSQLQAEGPVQIQVLDLRGCPNLCGPGEKLDMKTSHESVLGFGRVTQTGSEAVM